MPSTATALESPTRELARFLTEEAGLLQLPLEEVEKDIRRDPELYYPDHQEARAKRGRVAIGRESWIRRCHSAC
jgi:hypothetical protein